MTPEAKPPELTLGAISLNRMGAKHAGPCDFCEGDHKPPDEQPMLMIEGEKNFVTCCEYHEGLIIQTLLNNYVKRKKRGSKAGYTGPLYKEAACD